MEAWTMLKQNLMKTIQELKANHKDNWALIKSKSTPQSIHLLSTEGLVSLEQNIASRQTLIKEMSQRPSNQMLSPTDQAKYDQAVQELEVLQKKLDYHRQIMMGQLEPLVKEELAKVQKKVDEYWDQWLRANTKIDQLNDKLESLRSLIEVGDITKLQKMVREGKV